MKSKYRKLIGKGIYQGRMYRVAVKENVTQDGGIVLKRSVKVTRTSDRNYSMMKTSSGYDGKDDIENYLLKQKESMYQSERARRDKQKIKDSDIKAYEDTSNTNKSMAIYVGIAIAAVIVIVVLILIIKK